jgi:hypothetical protein
VQLPVHTPLTHVEPLQATAVPHVPLDWQVCTPLPEHCTAPGVHTPVQAPAEHTYVQATGLPNAPLAVQVSTPLPEHVVWLGAHTPVHVPLTHVWLLQAVPTVQVPDELHVSGWLDPEQLI